MQSVHNFSTNLFTISENKEEQENLLIKLADEGPYCFDPHNKNILMMKSLD